VNAARPGEQNGRCLVHIGAPKTGTTFLQQLCCQNRQELLRQGILYPLTGERRAGHHDYAFLLAGKYPDWATPQPRSLDALLSDLEKEIRSANTRDVLLSSEDFYIFHEPAELLNMLRRAGALANRQATIILYIRRQDAAHESWYNQSIKALGYHHTIDESIAAFHDLWDYDTQLKRWAGVFGDEALVVRAYEEQQLVNRTLASDFLHILGVEEADLVIPDERVNTGLNNDLLEIQRCINKLPLSIPEKRRFHKRMIELSQLTSGTGLFDEMPLVDASRASKILASYDAGNRSVAMKYFGRDELFLQKPDAAAGGTERVGITSEKLLLFLGWVMSRDE